MVVFPRIAEQINGFVKDGNNRVITADIAYILSVYFVRRSPNLRRKLSSKLPKVRIGILASFLTVKGDFDVKVFAVQLVVSSSEVFVDLNGDLLLSICNPKRNVA